MVWLRRCGGHETRADTGVSLPRYREREAPSRSAAVAEICPRLRCREMGPGRRSQLSIDARSGNPRANARVNTCGSMGGRPERLTVSQGCTTPFGACLTRAARREARSSRGSHGRCEAFQASVGALEPSGHRAFGRETARAIALGASWVTDLTISTNCAPVAAHPAGSRCRLGIPFPRGLS